MFKPQTFKVPAPPPAQELRLGADSNVRLDGGMSLKYIESQLNDNQSPYMLNLNADDRGSLTKRPGQAYVFTSLGTGGINAAYQRLYKGKKVFTWGTGLYTQDGSAQPVSIMSGLANAKGAFFVFAGILYYINGTDYVQWDGTTAVRVVGYVPNVTINRTPTGGGSINESLNLLSPYFIDSFNPDGTATVYKLSQTNLDATVLVASVDGGVTYNKAEGTDFTVNRTALDGAIVTFTVAPAVGQNTLKIKAAKTVSGNANRVLNCNIADTFGGENDTRVFLAGNPNYPSRLFRSGVADPTYFPDNAWQDVGTATPIYGLAKHFDKLITLKENSLYATAYQSINGTVSFPTYPLNSAIGCNMPGSIQIIDNNVVFGNSEQGLFILVSTMVKDERVVRPISGNVNGNSLRPGLLSNTKADLQAASSVDASGKYYLCVGNKAYVWDYRLSPFVNTGNTAVDEERLSWFPYDNINAACWVQYDGNLFYGDRASGQLVTFTQNYNDFGNPINGVWRSKLFNFNLPDYLKTITEVWFSTRAGNPSTMTIKYINDNGEVLDSTILTTSSFSWATATWATWSWFVSKFSPTIRTKPKIKKVIYFQVELSNNNFNENLSILSLVMRYLTVRKVK